MSTRETPLPQTGTHPIGRPRLLPAVTFGLRAAALAGLVVTGGPAVSELDYLAAGMEVIASDPVVGPPGRDIEPSTCCAGPDAA